MTKHHKQTIAERIIARAKLVHRMAMCTDGQRRDFWKGVLLIARQGPFYLFSTFYTEHEALAYAERAREKHIVTGRMPETMKQRQKREDEEEKHEQENNLDT